MNKLDTQQRRKEMLERHLRGETLEEIGRDFGLSRERVRQIMACDDGYCSLEKRRESAKVLRLRSENELLKASLERLKGQLIDVEVALSRFKEDLDQTKGALVKVSRTVWGKQ